MAQLQHTAQRGAAAARLGADCMQQLFAGRLQPGIRMCVSSHAAEQTVPVHGHITVRDWGGWCVQRCWL